MRAAASLDPDQTRRQLLEKHQDSPARQALPDDNLPCSINPVNLKNRLRDIETYCCD
jgi:hypothetical protein